MPGVVAEGRRVIANIERVANLFVTKTVYAMLLAIAVGVARWPYPFLPRHLTIISSLTIGIPAFFLALAPNAAGYVPGFVPRVLRFAIPAGRSSRSRRSSPIGSRATVIACRSRVSYHRDDCAARRRVGGARAARAPAYARGTRCWSAR